MYYFFFFSSSISFLTVWQAIQEAVEVLMKKVIDDFEAESRFQIEALANLFSKMAETLSVKLTKSIGEVLEISLMHIKIDFKVLNRFLFFILISFLLHPCFDCICRDYSSKI